MKTVDYLDLAKARANLPSDYALAARLGITRQAVSSWRSTTRPRYPEVLHGYLIAQLCGANPVEVLADIEIDKAERYAKADDLAAWRALMNRASTAAAAVFLGIAITGPAPANAEASGRHKPDNLYIGGSKRDRRRRSVMAAMARNLHSFSMHRVN